MKIKRRLETAYMFCANLMFSISKKKLLNLYIERDSKDRHIIKMFLITSVYWHEYKTFFLIREASLILILTLLQILHLVIGNRGSGVMVNSDLNKVLYGHSFLNITGITAINCLERCLANCLCLSFQVCHGNDASVSCQLCSSNKYIKPHAMRECKGCTSFNFGNLYEVNYKIYVV